MGERWIDERLYDDWRQGFRVKQELAAVTSRFQQIVIVDTFSHGRVMLLDGVVQITEADEFAYQEMLAHVPIIAHGSCRSVLIVGAGDGGVLRRVLQHAGVERVVMVEIDGEVMRLAREHLPGIGGSAWDDPRADVLEADGVEFVRDAADGQFDVVIVDSTDPIGVGETLFTDSFYRDLARVMTPAGLVVNQCGVPFMQADELSSTSRRRARFFDHVGAYVVAVPTYVGGFMTLGIAAKLADFDPGSPSLARSRALASGILGTTRYWSPDIHAAAFALPPYIARGLA